MNSEKKVHGFKFMFMHCKNLHNNRGWTLIYKKKKNTKEKKTEKKTSTNAHEKSQKKNSEEKEKKPVGRSRNKTGGAQRTRGLPI